MKFLIQFLFLILPVLALSQVPVQIPNSMGYVQAPELPKPCFDVIDIENVGGQKVQYNFNLSSFVHTTDIMSVADENPAVVLAFIAEDFMSEGITPTAVLHVQIWPENITLQISRNFGVYTLLFIFNETLESGIIASYSASEIRNTVYSLMKMTYKELGYGNN